MKNHFKYPILLTLCLAITTSLAFAASPIGSSQLHVYESNPTGYTRTPTTLPVSVDMMYDGDLGTNGWFRLYYTSSPPATVQFELNQFTNTPAHPFTIAWVDLKIKYNLPTALTDDSYRIEYTVSPSGTWTVIQPTVTGAASRFDKDGVAQVRPWTNLVEPNDGTWSWDDIANFRVRYYCTRGSTAWDNRYVNIYEVWLTIYDTVPPTSSTAMSIMPPSILDVGTPDSFFDVYVAGLTPPPGLWGWQVTILFDPAEIQILDFDYFSYWPLTLAQPYLIDNVNGAMSLSFSSFFGDSVGFEGTNMPLCRVYFAPLGGGGGGTKLDMVPTYTDPDTSLVYVTEFAFTDASSLTPTLYDGWVGNRRYMSYTLGMLPPGDPTGTNWHEEYPTYSTPWTLTSWLDNGDGYLSASDQIDMTTSADPGWIYWYHVDAVTTTIHFTFKDPTGLGVAETEVPTPYETDLPDPTDSRWHMIYPTYCRGFTITSWTDNDGLGTFNPSDQFDFEFDDDPGVPVWAHLDKVTTDIIVSMKYKEGGVPEFPLGIGVLMSLVAMIPVIYVWRTRPKKKVE